MVKKKRITEALEYVFEPIRKEGEKRRKDTRKAIREVEEENRRERAEEWSQKEAVFEVMPEAVRHVSGGGRLAFAVRKLYYAVRPRIAEYADKELSYDYFRDTLVVEYQRLYGEIAGLYFEPRGVLYEPHTSNVVQLGTREVDAYDLPAHLYNKLMYAEKTGLWPTLQDARLGERWDMAVATGSGYATTAARKLLAKAERDEGYQIFVLHDADPDGYNISRTVREETWRMPDHRVQVIDLGLTIADADEMGLPFEEFTRKRELPAEVEANLTDSERECFVGQRIGSKSRRCWRVELDAMTAPQTIEYIERKMEDAGARGKVIPPEDYLSTRAERTYSGELGRRVDAAISRQLDVSRIKQRAINAFRDEMALEKAREWIEDGFEEDDSQPWQEPVRKELDGKLDGRTDRIEEFVREMLDEDSR